jgi:hypothetical protein
VLGDLHDDHPGVHGLFHPAQTEFHAQIHDRDGGPPDVDHAAHEFWRPGMRVISGRSRISRTEWMFMAKKISPRVKVKKRDPEFSSCIMVFLRESLERVVP